MCETVSDVCLLCVCLGSVATEPSAEAAPSRKPVAKKGSGKKKGAVLGVVESVNKDVLVVKVSRGKKGKSAAKGQKTYQINAGTKVYRNGKAVGLGALDPGRRVVIHTASGQQVARVDIIEGKRKRKA